MLKFQSPGGYFCQVIPFRIGGSRQTVFKLWQMIPGCGWAPASPQQLLMINLNVFIVS